MLFSNVRQEAKFYLIRIFLNVIFTLLLIKKLNTVPKDKINYTIIVIKMSYLSFFNTNIFKIQFPRITYQKKKNTVPKD